MTMDERVEAAKRAMQESKAWPAVFRPKTADLLARVAVAAAFPELHGDKPTHWLAPMEATVRMSDAAWDTAPHRGDELTPTSAYQAMRDAYLGKGDGG